jgi:hypothetical protein
MAKYASTNCQYTSKNKTKLASQNRTKQSIVEDFPDGYPRFAALISTHSSFHVCRRFLRLRGRLMLHKQDNLVTLEEELDRIDREEPRVLFLGNRRRDKNEERKNIMNEIDRELESYGMLWYLLYTHVYWIRC